MASTLTQTPTTARASWLALSSAQQTFLKWLAIALMLVDHANRSLWSFQPWAFALGRIAFPLFAFLIAYNLAVRKVEASQYVGPLLLFGLLSQAPAMLALDRNILPLNIFFTLLLGSSLLPLRAWFGRHLPAGWLWQGLSWLAALYGALLLGVVVEYGPLGVLLIPSMMLFLRCPGFLSGVLVVGLLITLNAPQVTSLAALLVVPLIYAVSILKLPKLPRLKWVFYSFYPGHLLILWLLKISL